MRTPRVPLGPCARRGHPPRIQTLNAYISPMHTLQSLSFDTMCVGAPILLRMPSHTLMASLTHDRAHLLKGPYKMPHPPCLYVGTVDSLEDTSYFGGPLPLSLIHACIYKTAPPNRYTALASPTSNSSIKNHRAPLSSKTTEAL